LSRSPQLVRNPIKGDRENGTIPLSERQQQAIIWADSVDALIIPASACGGSAVLSLSDRHTQIVTVTENKTAIEVFPESLGIKTIQVNSYLEAVGAIVAHRAGIAIENLNPYLSSLRQIL
jgi:hypothetical protein